MAPDWRSAFVRQARSDFSVPQLLESNAYPLCHRLHYLQMTAEKLAKGYQCPPPGDRRPGTTHEAFLRFMRHASASPNLWRASGCESRQGFAAFLRDLLPLAAEIEKLAPVSEIERPNPEYPWEAKSKVVAPVDHVFTDLDLKKNPKLAKLVNFLHRCLNLV